jgi:acyl carrier protein
VGEKFMDDILTKIRNGILELFPDIGSLPITADMRLGEIPDFDSMAAVNLQTFLEGNFPLKIPLDMLNEETTIGELVVHIGKYVRKK